MVLCLSFRLTFSSQIEFTCLYFGNGSTSGKYRTYGLNNINPSNLDDLFASEIALPGVVDSDPFALSHMVTQMQINISLQGHSHHQK